MDVDFDDKLLIRAIIHGNLFFYFLDNDWTVLYSNVFIDLVYRKELKRMQVTLVSILSLHC